MEYWIHRMINKFPAVLTGLELHNQPTLGSQGACMSKWAEWESSSIKNGAI